jgi:hypothetical protein
MIYIENSLFGCSCCDGVEVESEVWQGTREQIERAVSEYKNAVSSRARLDHYMQKHGCTPLNEGEHYMTNNEDI